MDRIRAINGQACEKKITSPSICLYDKALGQVLALQDSLAPYTPEITHLPGLSGRVKYKRLWHLIYIFPRNSGCVLKLKRKYFRGWEEVGLEIRKWSGFNLKCQNAVGQINLLKALILILRPPAHPFSAILSYI